MIHFTTNKDALLTPLVEERVFRKYTTPHIEHVTLDSEISLALASPPEGPDETYNNAPDFLRVNSFNPINS
jgi:hypothetical protein